MLTVMISVVRSSLRPGIIVLSAILPLVVGEGDGLAADREIAALRPADVVLGHQDAGHVRVAPEGDPEEVEGLALLELGGREEGYAGIDLRQASALGRGVSQHRFHTDALD